MTDQMRLRPMDETFRDSEIELSDTDIAALFAGTNFGPTGENPDGQRGLMVECVFKEACGYADGSTILRICRDAGLLDEQNQPYRKGMRWAFRQIYKSGHTIVERLNSQAGEGLVSV